MQVIIAEKPSVAREIAASVGVCTRPSDQTPRPAATASACEALIPTIQSASLHQISPEKNFFKSRLEREKYQGNDYQYKEVDRIKLEQNIRIV